MTRALLALLTVFLGACDRAEDDSPPRAHGDSSRLTTYVLGQVATGAGPSSRRPIDALADGEVGRRFRRAVRDLAWFEEEPADGPMIDFELRWSVGMGEAEPPTGAAPAAPGADSEYVILYLHAIGEAAGSPQHQFDVQGIYRRLVPGGAAPRAIAEELVDEGIADLVEGIAYEAEPRCSDDARLSAILNEAGAESDRLLPAIREIHRRRTLPAAPALRRLLDSEDVELLLAAATALARLRDAESVSPLIDLISREHRELTENVLPLLGQIGTADAIGYLQTVADAHESPYVRRLAQEVLEERQ